MPSRFASFWHRPATFATRGRREALLRHVDMVNHGCARLYYRHVVHNIGVIHVDVLKAECDKVNWTVFFVLSISLEYYYTKKETITRMTLHHVVII